MKFVVKIILCTVFHVFLHHLILGQETHTLNGIIREHHTGEKLLGATVSLDKKTGVNTDHQGTFQLDLPAGQHNLTLSYVGYKPKIVTVTVPTLTPYTFFLENDMELEEITIKANKLEDFQHPALEKISLKSGIVTLQPGFMGEADVLKCLQTFAGVNTGAQGSSGLYVRGGTPDQNLVLMDGATVFNPFHLFGFFSIFTPEVYENAALIKGDFPASYGGRLSSVLDMNVKDGAQDKLHLNATIGIVSSKITLESPIGKKKKTSVLLSTRRSYIDEISKKLTIKSNSKQSIDNTFFFYDFTGKVSHRFSHKSKLSLTGYVGKDKQQTISSIQNNLSNRTTNVGMQWGNQVASLNWEYQVNSNWKSNHALSFSNYGFSSQQGLKNIIHTNIAHSENSNQINEGGISEATIASKWSYQGWKNNYLTVSFSSGERSFLPSKLSFIKRDYESNKDQLLNLYTLIGTSNETNLSIQDNISIGSKLTLNVGLRYGLYQYKSYQNHSLQPRIGIAFHPLSHKNIWTVNAAYSRMQQNMHLLINSTSSLPTDLWVPATSKIKPEVADHFSLSNNFTLNKRLLLKLGAYYKKMDQLTAYQYGSIIGTAYNWEQQVTQGTGKAYGYEVMLSKNKGKTTGWMSYTLSWNKRKFAALNNGVEFSHKYDRRHNLNIVLQHQVNQSVSINLNWKYMSGGFITVPKGIIQAIDLPEMDNRYYSSAVDLVKGRAERDVYDYGQRNSYALPAEHHLDISCAITPKPNKYFTCTWQFGVYNIYNQRNPFSVSVVSIEEQHQIQNISLFGAIPFVSYNIKI